MKKKIHHLEKKFHHHGDDEELLDHKVSYFSIIGTFMHLVNYACLNIAYRVNLLGRYNPTPIWRHQNDIKRFLHKTIEMNLFYSRKSKLQLLKYVDERYISNPWSQTMYVTTRTQPCRYCLFWAQGSPHNFKTRLFGEEEPLHI